ncbi:hypothetical protein [Microvirga sp. 2TAF3]|uniref:hypothetical protein n=1 Tax=Microvirga sp. 2TAF3 TaxID=3233014 RepID=UPI003F991959
MQDSLEDIAFAVGGAVVSPGPGSAELLLAILIACGFAFSTLYALFTGRHGHVSRWPERHS